MIRVFTGYGGFMPDAVQIAIVNDFGGDSASSPSRLIARMSEGGHVTWEQFDDSMVTTPTLTLSDDMARALLAELTRHYHGADDSRALRRDYDAERVRVDRLTEAVCGLAATLAQPPEPERVALRAARA